MPSRSGRFQPSTILPLAMRNMVIPFIVTRLPVGRNTLKLALMRATADPARGDPVAFRHLVFNRDLNVWKSASEHFVELFRAFRAVNVAGWGVADVIVRHNLVDEGQIALTLNLFKDLACDLLVLLRHKNPFSVDRCALCLQRNLSLRDRRLRSHALNGVFSGVYAPSLNCNSCAAVCAPCSRASDRDSLSCSRCWIWGQHS